MQRICWTLRVKPECMEAYREAHRHVWPEMLQALRETGWRNYSIFLREDGLLIGYLETDDFASARAGMARLEVNSRWQKHMAPYFESLSGRADEGDHPADHQTRIHRRRNG